MKVKFDLKGFQSAPQPEFFVGTILKLNILQEGKL